MPVAADRYTTEYFAAPVAGRRRGRDHRARERRIAVVAQGPQPSRRERDLAGARRRRAAGAAASPVYTPDDQRRREGRVADVGRAAARALYFMSDRSGAQNIWSRRARRAGRRRAERAKAVTTFRDGRVLWPTISRDGRTIAFERDFGIWTVDTATSQAREVPIALRGAPAAAGDRAPDASPIRLQELALSPDGKKVAFTVHGEIFSASAKDGGDAARVTTTRGRGGRARVGARQPAARVHVRPRRHASSLRLRLRQPAGDAADDAAARATISRGIRPTASGSRSSAIRASCASSIRRRRRRRWSPPACSTRRRSSTRATSPGRPTRASSRI